MTTNNLEMPMWPIVFRLLFVALAAAAAVAPRHRAIPTYLHTVGWMLALAVLPQQMETRQKLNKKENRFGPTKYFIPLIRCRVRNVEDYKDAKHPTIALKTKKPTTQFPNDHDSNRNDNNNTRKK